MFVAFSSCKDDDISNEKISEEAAQPYLGVYKGKMSVQIDNLDLNPMWQQVKVDYDTRGLTFRIESFWVNDVYLGNMLFEDIETEEINNTLDFKSLVNISLNNLNHSNIEIKGNISNNILNMDMKIKSVSSPDIITSMEANKRTYVENDTAYVEDIWFDDERIIMQPYISAISRTLQFYVTDTLEDSVQVVLAPRYKLSEGATTSLADVDSINFSTGSHSFIVWAEDSIHRFTYTLSMRKGQSLQYGLDTWEVVPTGETQTALTYYTPQDTDWQTSNEILRYFKQQGYYDMNATYGVEMETANVHGGTGAVKITTRKLPSNPLWSGLLSGILYTGEEYSFTGGLQDGFKYGVPFATRPVKIRGYYRYKPGNTFENGGIEELGIADTCRIYAVLYEITEDIDILDGTNLYSAENITALGVFESGETEGNDYIPFQFDMNFQTSYYFTKEYKLAIVCMSSRYGTRGVGAEESTLWIDEIEIISQDNYQ
ncbi:MAG: PCMD domain-containing protein [Odoribacter sp.]|nr:PCMD domain-containing protein [Odoribacter sp.]